MKRIHFSMVLAYAVSAAAITWTPAPIHFIAGACLVSLIAGLVLKN